MAVNSTTHNFSVTLFFAMFLKQLILIKPNNHHMQQDGIVRALSPAHT
jgi:hypothetical protein